LTLCVFFAGLKLLSIRSCPSVTPEGILSFLRLPTLKRFDYLTKDPVHKSFVVQLACQNPNLEVLSLKLSSDADNNKDDNPLCTKEFLREISHPRLRTLINFVKIHNFQSRRQSSHTIFFERRSSNDPDSDSDADDPMQGYLFGRPDPAMLHIPLRGIQRRIVNQP